MGGPISEGGRIAPAEAAAVLADVARRRTMVTEIKLRPGAAGDWLKASSHFAAVEHGMQCHVLDLAGGFATVWQDRFRGTARTAIRKAERSGLEVEDACCPNSSAFWIPPLSAGRACSTSRSG
jgi:hypothetical protein